MGKKINKNSPKEAILIISLIIAFLVGLFSLIYYTTPHGEKITIEKYYNLKTECINPYYCHINLSFILEDGLKENISGIQIKSKEDVLCGRATKTINPNVYLNNKKVYFSCSNNFISNSILLKVKEPLPKENKIQIYYSIEKTFNDIELKVYKN